MKKTFRFFAMGIGSLTKQMFLIGPGERLLSEHRDRFAGDHVDLNRVLAAAEQ